MSYALYKYLIRIELNHDYNSIFYGIIEQILLYGYVIKQGNILPPETDSFSTKKYNSG